MRGVHVNTSTTRLQLIVGVDTFVRLQEATLKGGTINRAAPIASCAFMRRAQGRLRVHICSLVVRRDTRWLSTTCGSYKIGFVRYTNLTRNEGKRHTTRATTD